MSRKNKRQKPMSASAEAQAESQEMELAPAPNAIDFDGWWAARAAKIPPQHHKEIIKADFRGRGLSMMETMEDFDEALKEYGIKL